jgi:hypothetical protein
VHTRPPSFAVADKEDYEDVAKTTPPKNAVNKQGYVNAEIVAEHAAVSRKPRIEDGPIAWSVGTMSREDCKAALATLPPGSFVIRESSSNKGALVLVGRRPDKVIERKIASEGGQYLVSQPGSGVQAYDTLVELLIATEIAETPVARALVDPVDDADYKGDGKLPEETTGPYVNVQDEDIDAAKRMSLSKMQDRKIHEELAAWEQTGEEEDF